MSGEGRELMQLVTVVRGADRHEDVHERRIEDLEGNPRPVMTAIVYMLLAGCAIAFVVSVWP